MPITRSEKSVLATVSSVGESFECIYKKDVVKMISHESNMTVDVIVVGYGAAGAAAALTAHEYGAETLIIEKMQQPGGNSYVSSANMVFPKNTEDADKLADYLNEVNFGTTEPELVDTFAQVEIDNTTRADN